MTGPLGATSVSWGALRKTAEDAMKPLPNDWYDVVVVKAEPKVASTGSNMVACTLEVETGPSKTRRLFTNFVLSPENGFALGIFFRNMGAFGLDDSFFAQIEQYPIEQGMQMIADALQGRPARVKVGTRTWQGQERNECSEFASRAGGGPLAPGVKTGPAFIAGPGGGQGSQLVHPGGPLVHPGGPGPSTPTSPAPAAGPTVPTTPTAPTTPQVPGPPPPPQPAF